MLVKNATFLSPAEAAKRLGATPKALRLYEARGLVKPLRSQADWRAYGPEQMARLHQILALKRLGLSLARIAELLKPNGLKLDAVLAIPVEAMEHELVEARLALEEARQEDAVVVRMWLRPEDGDVEAIRREREDPLETGDAGHTVADDHETLTHAAILARALCRHVSGAIIRSNSVRPRRELPPIAAPDACRKHGDRSLREWTRAPGASTSSI